ncbi:MAG: mechanosensitive ion channel [Bernardetiaceae bacterium]|nr:mechanosensitive ion channel [Bernardetiaceae bacterium]
MKFSDVTVLVLAYCIEFSVLLILGRLIFLMKIGIRQRFILWGFFSFLLTSLLLVVRELQPELFVLRSELLPYAFIGIRCVWWFAIAIILSNLLHYFLWNGIFHKNGQTRVHRYVIQFFDATIYVLAVVLILNQVFEQSISGLLITSGVLAIILGLSAQTTLGGVFAGLALNLNNSFNKGDYIILDRIRGYVIDMNWHSVTIQGRDERMAIIPNKLIDDSLIINSNAMSKRRLHDIEICIDYAVRPELVKSIIIEAVKHSPYVEGEAQVFVSKFAETGIFYKIEIYTSEFEDIPVNNDLLTLVWYALAREHISARPSIWQRESEFTPPLIEQVSMLDSSDTILKTLRSISFFEVLSESELQQLAQKTVHFIAPPPQRITVEGEAEYALYIVQKGRLSVWVKNNEGQDIQIASLKVGDVFGEMALLTGELRKATVVVEQEASLYEISKSAILPIITKRKEILNDLSKLLAERQLAVEQVQANEDKPKAREAHIEKLNIQLLALMRNFFASN